MKSCIICSQPLPKHAHKFCSHTCKRESWRKPCKNCGVSFVPTEARIVFCSRSCSAHWNAKQPEIIQKIRENRDHEKAGKAISKAILSNQSEIRRRKRDGAKYGKLGGGWKSPQTSAGELVLRGLFPDAKPNYPIKTGGSSKRGEAHCYKLDLAWPDVLLNVEVDGSYHGLQSQIAKDAKRDAFMKSNGWTVHRVKEEAVRKNPNGIRDEIEAILNTCRA